VSKATLWVLAGVCLGFCPVLARAAEATTPEVTDSALEAWLTSEPEQQDTSGPDADLEPPPPPPRRHGVVLEGSVGALGHLGNMRTVSPVAPWFRLQAGYELFDWLMLFGEGDVSVSSTSLANRPPDARSYALFGFGAGARLSLEAVSWLGFYAQGDAGFASINQDVLATYGYPDADRLSPYAGGSLGIEWFQTNPHYGLSLSGGARDYLQNFDRQNGDRPPWVWMTSLAIRYAL